MAKVYVICSTLMAALFTVSASMQFNDPDWYFWIPLYTCAAYVNLASCWASLPLTGIKLLSKVTLWQAEYLLSKVILDDYFGDIAGFWSLDMKEKVVREKLGSVLVSLCMILQSSAAKSFNQDPSKRKKTEVGPSIKYGMAILVGISYGLSLVFLMYHEQEMKF